MSVSDHNATTLHRFNLNQSPTPRPFLLDENNAGYRLLVQAGWNERHGLGRHETGRLQPIKTRLKPDRLGVGRASVQPLRISHSHDPRRELDERFAQVRPSVVHVSDVNLFDTLDRMRVAAKRDQLIDETDKRRGIRRMLQRRREQREQLRNTLLAAELADWS